MPAPPEHTPSGLRLATIGGIPVYIGSSWFLLAAIIAGGAGFGLLYFFPDFALAGRWQAFITTAVVGTVMLLFFIGACYLLRVRELHSIIGVVAGKLRKTA